MSDKVYCPVCGWDVDNAPEDWGTESAECPQCGYVWPEAVGVRPIGDFQQLPLFDQPYEPDEDGEIARWLERKR